MYAYIERNRGKTPSPGLSEKGNVRVPQIVDDVKGELLVKNWL